MTVNAHKYPVAVAVPNGAARQQVLLKLEEMQRELSHIQTAVTEMKRAIVANDSRPLASSVLNSRNWLLSIVESHSFLQTAVHGSGGSGAASPFVHLDLLFARSVKLGLERGSVYRRM